MYVYACRYARQKANEKNVHRTDVRFLGESSKRKWDDSGWVSHFKSSIIYDSLALGPLNSVQYLLLVCVCISFALQKHTRHSYGYFKRLEIKSPAIFHFDWLSIAKIGKKCHRRSFKQQEQQNREQKKNVSSNVIKKVDSKNGICQSVWAVDDETY